jgi:hypothetical protein
VATSKSSSKFSKRISRQANRWRKAANIPLRLFATRTLSRLHAENLNVPFLCANIRGDRPHPDALTVLCLDRQNFSKDIDELRKRTRLNWLTLRHRFCGAVQTPWTPEPSRRQMFYVTATGPDVEAAKERSVAFFRRFVQALRERKIDAVMSANNDYWQDGAIRTACALEGFPFLTLSREHYITRAMAAERVRLYQESGFKFNGAGVAVFGPQTRETMLRAEVCPPEKIWVTGPPRLDPWREVATPEKAGPLFLLISFALRGYGGQETCRQTFGELARFADTCPDPSARFVVKCRNEEDRQILQSFSAEFPSRRLQLILNANLLELMSQARAVIGFNSLALLESLLSPARICVPNWADAAGDPENQMLEPSDSLARDCVAFADSAQQFRAWLERTAAEPVLADERPARMALLRKFFHYPDETTCCEEVARFVEEAVNGERQM